MANSIMLIPANSGSIFFKYEGFHSIVLIVLCDAHYKFSVVDVGDIGRHSDRGVLSNSDFGQALDNGTLSFTSDSPLAETTIFDID